MESTEQNQKLSTYCKRIAIVSCFLLAMLWPIGSFVFWIMTGAITYFTFLSFYYQPKPNVTFKKSYATSTYASSAPQLITAVDLLQKIKTLKPIHLIILCSGLIFLLAIIIPNVTTPNLKINEINRNSNIDSLIDKGNAEYNRGQYESALSNYEKVLQSDPTNQFGLYNKALVFYSKKDYRKSISLARYCVVSNPDYSSAYYLLGDNYKFMNQFDSAHIFFMKAYELGARDAGLLQNLGDIYYDRKEQEDAIQFYKEALEQDSSVVYVYERLAELEPNQAQFYKQKSASLKK